MTEKRITVEQIKERSELSASEIADELHVSRQYISWMAKEHQIALKRKPKQISRFTCKNCGVTREIPTSELRRKKTEYCSKCHLKVTQLWRRGVAASPRTKKSST